MSVSSLASAVSDDRASTSAPARPTIVVVGGSPSKTPAPTAVTEAVIMQIADDLAADKDTRKALNALAAAVSAEPDKGALKRAGAPATDDTKTAPQQLAAALGVLVMWIPTEVVAAYAAFVLMIQPATGAQDASVAIGIWLVALLATPLLIWVAAWAKKARGKTWNKGERRRLTWSVLLSPVAFFLWSASIPQSAWTLFGPFKANSAAFLFALLIVVGVFTVVASKLTETTPAEEKKAAKQKADNPHGQ
jgi:hypothetical protein